MWHPDVLRRAEPGRIPGAEHVRASRRICAHRRVRDVPGPSRRGCSEHNWNQNPPGKTNPAFPAGSTPYFFNHGRPLQPRVALFFDLHIAQLPIAQP
jgi:hypothetical protein